MVFEETFSKLGQNQHESVKKHKLRMISTKIEKWYVIVFKQEQKKMYINVN